MKSPVAAAVCLLAVGTAAVASEGMWTPDNLPRVELRAKYQFDPDQKWADHVQRAALRLAGGCSGAFVSPAGLVLTNHHCVSPCVQQLSTADKDFVKSGFYAKEEKDEIKCPEIELNRLDTISDVTKRVKEALAGKEGEDYIKAEKGVRSDIEKECVGNDAQTTRCDVVALYHGGIYDLYRYQRFQDVRLVFAPELAIAFFGGDPDNFNFPRYDLDIGVLRAYQDGRPAKVADFFPFSKSGAGEGELTIVVGHPGGTDRQLTLAELESARDDDLIPYLLVITEQRGVLEQFSSESSEHARIAHDELFLVENAYKAYRGQLRALQDPAVFERLRKREAELREYVNADAARKAKYGAAWDEIRKAMITYHNIGTRLNYIEFAFGFNSDYFRYARTLVRGPEERAKPNHERLREFSESKLPSLVQSLLSTAPVYPDFERVKFGLGLAKLREVLGTDDALVRQVLGRESPQAVADRLVAATRLGDPAVRKALWDGGAEALAKSDDPFIALARSVDPAARSIRKQYENEVESVQRKNSELIAAARFEKYGTSEYPDATFTQRFSFGEVKGWEAKGTWVHPCADIAGAFARATGSEPFALPQSWLDARQKLDPKQCFNFVTTNDIIGGNSGSPVINRDAEVVGLIFDGNIESLGSDYWFDERANRAIAVHSGAIVQALTRVYKADRLVREIDAARRTHGPRS